MTVVATGVWLSATRHFWRANARFELTEFFGAGRPAFLGNAREVKLEINTMFRSVAKGSTGNVALRCGYIGVVVGLIVAVPILGVDVYHLFSKLAVTSERMLNLMPLIGPDSYISARTDAVAAMARSKALPAIHLSAQ